MAAVHRILSMAPQARQYMHQKVFPPDECSPEHHVDLETARGEGGGREGAGGGGDNRNMKPKISMPPESLRARLVDNMTNINYELKKYTEEVVFLICDEDPGELVRVAGVGSSAAILAAKGLLGGGAASGGGVVMPNM